MIYQEKYFSKSHFLIAFTSEDFGQYVYWNYLLRAVHKRCLKQKGRGGGEGEGAE